jgi:hypothetical protein
MTTYAEKMQTIIRPTIPAVVKSMGEVATNANTSATTRLKAIELLLRVAIGPSTRPSEPSDVVNGRNARTALSRALPFLEQIVTTHKSPRMRLKAAKLVGCVGNVAN